MIYSLLFGRIGNILCEVAAASFLADRYGQDFQCIVVNDYICPKPDNCRLEEYIKPYKLSLLSKIKFVDSYPEGLRTLTDACDLATVQLQPNESVVLNGFFQDPRYVKPKVLQQWLVVPADVQDEIRNKYPQIGDGSQWCSIMSRRGDYLDQKNNFAICESGYFHRAMRHVEKQAGKVQYIISGDDMDWCRKHIKGSNVHYIDDEPPMMDLFLAAQCKHHILPNSSFACWGVWLSKHKDGVTTLPYPWFGPSQRRLEKEKQQIMPQEWVRINNLSWAFLEGCWIYFKGAVKKHLHI